MLADLWGMWANKPHPYAPTADEADKGAQEALAHRLAERTQHHRQRKLQLIQGGDD